MHKSDTFGLSPDQLAQLTDVFSQYTDIDSVVVFGSRALGTHTSASDIDICIYGEQFVVSQLGEIKNKLEETTVPYFVDLVHYQSLEHKKLKEHIDRVGRDLFFK